MTTTTSELPGPLFIATGSPKSEMVEDLVYRINSRPLPCRPKLREPAIAERRALTEAADRTCEFLLASGRCAIEGYALEGNALREQVRITDMVGIKRPLRNFWKDKGLTREQLDRLLHYWKRLLRFARHFGWTPPVSALDGEWEPMMQAAVGFAGVRDLIDHAIVRGLHTWEYTLADQDLWAAEKREDGCTDDTIKQVRAGFRSAVRRAGLQDLFPLFDCGLRTLPPARLKFEAMTPPLRRELLRLFSRRWQYATRCQTTLDRNRERLRIHSFQSLCWYAAKVLHIAPLVSLNQVLTKAVVGDWALYLHHVKGCNHRTIGLRLGAIHNCLKKHPDFGKQNFHWILDALTEVQKDPESAKNARITERITNYKQLLAIIRPMRQARLAAMRNGSPLEVAWLVHDQLLFMFLALALMPAKCVCGCRFGGEHPNLFNLPLHEEDMPADVQGWANELRAKDSDVPLWQYRFDPLETPMRAAIHGVLHSFLVPLLKLYVDPYRGELLKGHSDPGTLFFSRKRKALTVVDLARLIGNLTSKFGPSGKRILPSAFKTIFGNYWDRKHPGKHEQLARILGQRIPYVREKFKREKGQ